ncbi:MAG: glycerophosphodiester phosphodiesterase [Bacteroidales bacterium]|nr:glycerophosphodiester phosphodiesterase [Bacteroidales bacterium]
MKRHLLITAALSLLLGWTLAAQTQEVRIFSHRGGRMEYDENTLSAFQASYDAGYRGFETDIRMTRDGAFVITHDHTLDRTTNGHGIIEEKTEAEVRALRTKGGHKMLFLDELLDWLKDKKGLYVEFELKTRPEHLYPKERLEPYCDHIYHAIKAVQPADAQFVITSGDTRGLRYIQQKYPDADLLLIVGRPCNDETIALCKAMGIKRLGAKIEGTSRKDVEKAHKEGLIVSLWPGHCPEDAVLGTYLGADYLCTDTPIAVKTFLDGKMPWIKARY